MIDYRQKYIEAARAYNDGEPIMSDAEFDRLEKEMRDIGGFDDILNKTHDELNGGDLEDKSFSILPLDNWTDIMNWVTSKGERLLVMSLKIDGVNFKGSKQKVKFEAQSRGRKTDVPWDYTEGIKANLPELSDDESFLITGEAYVPAKWLEYFKEKYDKTKYKMPRSAAVSLLRRPQDYSKEDLQKLEIYPFTYQPNATSKLEMWDKLEELGFNKIPRVILKENTMEEIKEAMYELKLQADKLGIPSDGIVLEVDDQVEDFGTSNDSKYQGSQVALKVDEWQDQIFSSKVIGIELNPGKTNFGTVLLIEPILLPSGSTQRKINAHNIGIILNNGIEIGSEIKFFQKANGMCDLIYR